MKKVWIIVDYQNDFVSGSLGFSGAEALDSIIAEKIIKAREANEDIIVTYDTHDEDYLETQEGRTLPIQHCIKRSDGWELYGKTGELLYGHASCFCKGTFGSLDLANYLRTKEYDCVELCGLVSNICVISNAVLAKSALPEAEIIVDAKATASADPSLHQKALDVMKGLQIKIIND